MFRRNRKGDLWQCKCGEQWLFDDHMSLVSMSYEETVWWRRSDWDDLSGPWVDHVGTPWERHMRDRKPGLKVLA